MRIRQTRNQFDHNALLLLVLIVSAIGTIEAQVPQASKEESPKATERNKYSIDFKIDFDRLSYTGSERVRWTNHVSSK